MLDSHYLSYLLRHHPEDKNLHLDEFGWCLIDELVSALHITKEELDKIVNDNTRYIYNEAKTHIKAAHGHSIPIKYTTEKIPPRFLYHGTADRFLDSIEKEGLKKMTREAVHLSEDFKLAEEVGARHSGGSLNHTFVLTIDAKKMYDDGFKFYKSEDGVWLVDSVPTKYIVY